MTLTSTEDPQADNAATNDSSVDPTNLQEDTAEGEIDSLMNLGVNDVSNISGDFPIPESTERWSKNISIPFGWSTIKPLCTSHGKDGYMKEYWVNEWIGDIRRQVFKLLHKQTWHAQFTRPSDRRVVTRTFSVRSYGENVARANAYNLMPWDTGDSELRRPLGRPMKRRHFNPIDFEKIAKQKKVELKIEDADITDKAEERWDDCFKNVSSRLEATDESAAKEAETSNEKGGSSSTLEPKKLEEGKVLVKQKCLDEFIDYIIPSKETDEPGIGQTLELFNTIPFPSLNGNMKVDCSTTSALPNDNSNDGQPINTSYGCSTAAAPLSSAPPPPPMNKLNYSPAQLFCMFCNTSGSRAALGVEGYKKIFSLIFPDPYNQQCYPVNDALLDVDAILKQRNQLEEYIIVNRMLQRLAQSGNTRRVASRSERERNEFIEGEERHRQCHTPRDRTNRHFIRHEVQNVDQRDTFSVEKVDTMKNKGREGSGLCPSNSGAHNKNEMNFRAGRNAVDGKDIAGDIEGVLLSNDGKLNDLGKNMMHTESIDRENTSDECTPSIQVKDNEARVVELKENGLQLPLHTNNATIVGASEREGYELDSPRHESTSSSVTTSSSEAYGTSNYAAAAWSYAEDGMAHRALSEDTKGPTPQLLEKNQDSNVPSVLTSNLHLPLEEWRQPNGVYPTPMITKTDEGFSSKLSKELPTKSWKGVEDRRNLLANGKNEYVKTAQTPPTSVTTEEVMRVLAWVLET